jgi:hypothetical protein
MAVSIITTGTAYSAAQHIQALSSDDLPLTLADGSTCHVVDTGEQRIKHDGAWIPDLRLSYAHEAL